MPRLVAPSNLATFPSLYILIIFWLLSLKDVWPMAKQKKKNHQDCRRKHRFWIKSSGWSLSTSSFDHPTWPAGLSQGGESQENAVSAWCKSCSWLMSCLSKMKWMKWDSGWPDNVKAETVLPTSLLRHPGSIWWTRRVHNIMSRQSPEL